MICRYRTCSFCLKKNFFRLLSWENQARNRIRLGWCVGRQDNRLKEGEKLSYLLFLYLARSAWPAWSIVDADEQQKKILEAAKGMNERAVGDWPSPLFFFSPKIFFFKYSADSISLSIFSLYPFLKQLVGVHNLRWDKKDSEWRKIYLRRSFYSRSFWNIRKVFFFLRWVGVQVGFPRLSAMFACSREMAE